MPTTITDHDKRVPYTMPLPAGKTVVVHIPADMVEYDLDGEMMFTPAGGQLLDRIRALAMDAPQAPSPAYIRTLREALDMTQSQLAKQLGCATITIKKWEAGDARPREKAATRLRKLAERATRRGVVVTS